MISDGRSQSQRQLPALSGDYFHLNEMRFEQLLAIASEYARLMHFYQPDLNTDGDWYQFFAADETVLIATILAVDTHFSQNSLNIDCKANRIIATGSVPTSQQSWTHRIGI
jgi:hypothetical protein